MSYLDRIRRCNNADTTAYLPFVVDGDRLGLMKPDFAARLAEFPDVFTVTPREVALTDGLDGFDRRTAAVGEILGRLEKEGLIPHWRDEPYPVTHGFGQPALFNMERAAAVLFGIRGFGVHLNGFVRTPEGLKMWIGFRAKDRPVAPGKLDQLVAGGQPAGLSLRENLIKECGEEAALSPDVVQQAIPVGAVSYVMERDNGLRRDVLFIYDLELPADFTPVNTDGELEKFELWPIERVAETARDTDAFKFNCSLVVIDFLIRHGVLPPDHPEYLDLLKGLRSL